MKNVSKMISTLVIVTMLSMGYSKRAHGFLGLMTGGGAIIAASGAVVGGLTTGFGVYGLKTRTNPNAIWLIVLGTLFVGFTLDEKATSVEVTSDYLMHNGYSDLEAKQIISDLQKVEKASISLKSIIDARQLNQLPVNEITKVFLTQLP